MPYVLRLNQLLTQAGWKVRIHDSERLEPPHVTIYRKRRKWRLSLRDGSFLDKGDAWRQIDKRVKAAIQAEPTWNLLQSEWDKIHAENPVEGRNENE